MRNIFNLLLLASLASCVSKAPITSQTSSSYNRKEWKHWIDSDRDCLDTRAEILQVRSRKPVKMNAKGCVVLEGEWDDYYISEIHTQASSVDIDHLIPLKHAFEKGGKNWSTEQKKTFANDPANLVITNRSYNRSKGAKTPLEWLPANKNYACRYLKDWIRVKTHYALLIEKEELSSVSGCD